MFVYVYVCVLSQLLALFFHQLVLLVSSTWSNTLQVRVFIHPSQLLEYVLQPYQMIANFIGDRVCGRTGDEVGRRRIGFWVVWALWALWGGATGLFSDLLAAL